MTEPRDRIVAHAIRLFASQGYSGTSVRQIVEAAGVTKPTLYYHFGNKEGLHLALIQESLGAWVDETERLLDAPMSARDRLSLWATQALQGAIDQPELVRFLVRSSLADELCAEHHRHFRRQRQVLAAVLQQGQAAGEFGDFDSDEAAFSLIGLVQIRIMAAVQAGQPISPSTADTLLQLFFHGVSK